MKLGIIVIFFVICLADVFTIGFYLLFQNQLSISGIGGLIVPVGGIIGCIAGTIAVAKFVLDLLKSVHLEFGEIRVSPKREYFIKIHKKGKGNIAQGCEGKIEIGNIDTHSVWALGEVRVIDIADKMELMLFILDGVTISIFHQLDRSKNSTIIPDHYMNISTWNLKYQSTPTILNHYVQKKL
jgi:hypothetical protein